MSMLADKARPLCLRLLAVLALQPTTPLMLKHVSAVEASAVEALFHVCAKVACIFPILEKFGSGLNASRQ